jgi:precorrin-6B methylase 2
VASEIDRRAIVVSLGKVGGEKSLAIVRGIDAGEDASLARNVTRAKLVLERTTTRAPSTIELDSKLPAPMTLVWRCRRGLESIVLEQAGKGKLDKAEVSAERAGTLRGALAVRSALDVCIEVPLEGRTPAEAITDEKAIAAMQAWTKGGVRFRAEFLRGGHRRAELWEMAESVSKRTDAITSDPTSASWDVLVDEERSRLLLRPKAFEDPRFAYRVSDIPAASHPTIAAALAHVGGQRPDDVVWDPFVGSGLELIERARSGPYARLVGSDIDEKALESARQNLASAHEKATLVLGDARSQRVHGVTLVITNPPMGRRLVRDKSLGDLYDALIENVRSNLVPGGRMVWLSAMPERTAGMARTVGFTVDRGRPVDVGGFEAELQILRAPDRAATASGPRPHRSPTGRRPSR